MVVDGGALDVIELDHSLCFMIVKRGINCEMSRYSIPTNVETWLTSIELCPAKNVQAGHGALLDTMPEVPVSAVPKRYFSL